MCFCRNVDADVTVHVVTSGYHTVNVFATFQDTDFLTALVEKYVVSRARKRRPTSHRGKKFVEAQLLPNLVLITLWTSMGFAWKLR